MLDPQGIEAAPEPAVTPESPAPPPPWRAAGSRRWTRFLWPAVQATLSASILVWIFKDPVLREQVAETLGRARWGWLALGVLVAGGWIAAAALRWCVFLRVQGVPLPFRRAVCVYLISLFFTLFLPGDASSGAVRVFYVWRAWPGRKTAAILSVITDYLAGFVSLLLFALLFTFSRAERFEGTPIPEAALHFLGGFIVLTLIGLVFCFGGIQTGFINTIPRSTPGRAKIMEFAQALALFVRQWRASLLGIAISVVVLGGFFGTFYCAARAFGARISLLDVMTFMPVVDAIVALPVTISGLGVREKLFDELLAQFGGVPTATAVLVSLTGFGVSAVWSVIGGLLLPLYRTRMTEPAAIDAAGPAVVEPALEAGVTR